MHAVRHHDVQYIKATPRIEIVIIGKLKYVTSLLARLHMQCCDIFKR